MSERIEEKIREMEYLLALWEKIPGPDKMHDYFAKKLLFIFEESLRVDKELKKIKKQLRRK